MYSKMNITTKAVFDIETGELLHRESYEYCGPLDLCDGADEPDTQDPPAEGNDGAENQDSYFLEIDDRTRYRTAEEAAEGYRQAGQRIAELTPWQATAAEYGLTKPDDVAALLDELAELRAKSNGKVNDGAETKAPTATPDPATPEGKQAAAIDWLKKNGVEAGLVSKDQLSEISNALEGLKTENERVQQERFNQRVESGHNYLLSELKNAGIFPTDPKDVKGTEAATALTQILEDSIATWINQDKKRIEAFHAGGERLTSMLKERLQTMLPTLNVLRASSSASYTDKKTQVAPKKQTPAVPNNGKPKLPGSKVAPKPEDGITNDTHERAFALLQSITGGDQA